MLWETSKKLITVIMWNCGNCFFTKAFEQLFYQIHHWCAAKSLLTFSIVILWLQTHSKIFSKNLSDHLLLRHCHEVLFVFLVQSLFSYMESCCCWGTDLCRCFKVLFCPGLTEEFLPSWVFNSSLFGYLLCGAAVEWNSLEGVFYSLSLLFSEFVRSRKLWVVLKVVQ